MTKRKRKPYKTTAIRPWASDVKITTADGEVRVEPALPGSKRTNLTRPSTGHRFGALGRKKGKR